jgi:hypothetical protein
LIREDNRDARETDGDAAESHQGQRLLRQVFVRDEKAEERNRGLKQRRQTGRDVHFAPEYEAVIYSELKNARRHQQPPLRARPGPASAPHPRDGEQQYDGDDEPHVGESNGRQVIQAQLDKGPR